MHNVTEPLQNVTGALRSRCGTLRSVTEPLRDVTERYGSVTKPSRKRYGTLRELYGAVAERPGELSRGQRSFVKCTLNSDILLKVCLYSVVFGPNFILIFRLLLPEIYFGLYILGWHAHLQRGTLLR